MTDATANLTALGVSMEVTPDPWKRHSPYEGWKVFYRVMNWENGFSTFDVKTYTRAVVQGPVGTARMAVLK